MRNNTTITAQVNKGTFIKINGEPRTMRFVRLVDLPSGMISESAQKHVDRLQQLHGSEIVYDIDKQDYRAYNWKKSTNESKSVQTVTVKI
jgi:hypothetical protein